MALLTGKETDVKINAVATNAACRCREQHGSNCISNLLLLYAIRAAAGL
jgi:hypothetical protein